MFDIYEMGLYTARMCACLVGSVENIAAIAWSVSESPSTPTRHCSQELDFSYSLLFLQSSISLRTVPLRPSVGLSVRLVG